MSDTFVSEEADAYRRKSIFLWFEPTEVPACRDYFLFTDMLNCFHAR